MNQGIRFGIRFGIRLNQNRIRLNKETLKLGDQNKWIFLADSLSKYPQKKIL